MPSEVRMVTHLHQLHAVKSPIVVGVKFGKHEAHQILPFRASSILSHETCMMVKKEVVLNRKKQQK